MDYQIDAKGKILGRLASEIAIILQGKHRSNYDPRLAGEDRVLVRNVDKMIFSGEKMKKKIYYRHTGYIGHLKKKRLEEVFKENPEQVLKEAVRRMLPKNRLLKDRLKRLIFVNE